MKNNAELYNDPKSLNPYTHRPNGKRLSSKQIFSRFSSFGRPGQPEPPTKLEVKARNQVVENRLWNLANPDKPKRSVNVSKIRKQLRAEIKLKTSL